MYWWAKRPKDPEGYHLHSHINLQVGKLGQLKREQQVLKKCSFKLREHVTAGSEENRSYLKICKAILFIELLFFYLKLSASLMVEGELWF